MPRFYINSVDIVESNDDLTVDVKGLDAAHISKVLRMKLGDKVTLCDENGYEYSSTVVEIGDVVRMKINETKLTENETPYYSTVYQALVKGDRFDTVIQKSTELGVKEIVPVITSRCVVKIEEKEYSKKVERWQRIAYEASKQCGRGSVPIVRNPIKLTEAVKQAAESDVSLFCYEGDNTEPISNILSKYKSPKMVSVIIGPEGGFADDEVEIAKRSGLALTGLGKRILRTETAAPFVLSCLSYQFEI